MSGNPGEDSLFSGVLSGNGAGLCRTPPLTLHMRELGGDETYGYLDGSLPVSAGRPSGIRGGGLSADVTGTAPRVSV